MIDTLLASQRLSKRSPILDQLGLAADHYAVLTLYRPTNVDHAATFTELMRAIHWLQSRVPVVFPVHPRTRKALAEQLHEEFPNLRITDPLDYLDFIKLVSHARVVLTDSGGLQRTGARACHAARPIGL